MRYLFLCAMLAMITGCSSDRAANAGAPSSATPSTSNTTNNPSERLRDPQTGELRH